VFWLSAKELVEFKISELERKECSIKSKSEKATNQ
jgi:hypothetical protein